MKKILTILFVLMVSMSINNSIFAQANSVGLNGSFTFNTIASAYASIGAIGSPQIIELSSSYTGSDEIAPVSLTNKVGANAGNTITIRPSAGANGLVLSKSSTTYIIRFDSCKYVIVDGRPGGVVSSPANYLTITNTATGASAGAAGFFGAENCNFQYINANGVAASTGCRTINIAGGITVSSKNNLVQNNVVKGGLRGIQNFGATAGLLNVNDTVRSNDISQFFTLGVLSSNNTGAVFQLNHVHFTSAILTVANFLTGMQIQSAGTVIDQNEIDGLTSINCVSYTHITDFGANNLFTKNNLHDPIIIAPNATQVVGVQFSSINGTTRFSENQIHDFSFPTTSAAASFVIALTFSNNNGAANIYDISKNKIYNLSTVSATNIRAMSVFPFRGSTVNISNNFVSITQPNTTATAIFGILIGGSGVSSIKYNSSLYFNSIRIGGTRIGGTAGATNSYGILRDNDSVGSVYNQKNNISINERTTGDANTQIQIASWITTINGTIDVDYNTYYATDSLGGFAAGWRDTLYKNTALAAYKAYAFPQESHSNFNYVNFVSNTDLHLAGSSIGDGSLAGIPIAGITTDIDNQTRSTINPYRGADEATGAALMATLTLTINFQAINVPPSLQPQDTIIVELRSVAAGHALVDVATGLGGSSIPTTFQFANAVDGVPYYIVVIHRNSITTWSSLTPVFSSLTSSYDFTIAQSQAFGNNLILVGSEWSIYTGDVTRDGVVNLSDVLQIKNDNTNFVTGPYVITDLNWNGVVDLNDILFAFNNNVNFVSEKAPSPGPTPGTNLPLVTDSREGSNAGVYMSNPSIKSADQVGNTVIMDK